MGPRRPVTTAAFLAAEEPPEGACLEGEELIKLFWMVRGRAEELTRQEAFWAATNDALADAYAELEARTAELKAAREELLSLNRELERRVQAQVVEIVEHARQVEALNVQLQRRVQERSRELSEALKRLSVGRARGELEAGAVVGDRVRIERPIGRGGMGTVYVGIDLLTDQRVAVKLTHPDIESSPTALRRFVDEAGTASLITHPGVVKTLAIDITQDGRLYQVMEYVEGVDLGHLRGERLPFASVARVGAAVARALSASHAAGIVHRDVKPSNVMLCRAAPGVRVVDFGISKLLSRESSSPGAGMTEANEFVGTLRYSSPEQIERSSSVQPQSDVYNLGVVLYELLCGRPPFEGSSTAQLVFAHLYEEPADIDPSQAPRELRALIMACLAKRASERPSARSLSASLDVIADSAGAPKTEQIAGELLAVMREQRAAPTTSENRAKVTDEHSEEDVRTDVLPRARGL